MFANIIIGTFRRWQAEKKVSAIVIQSHGEYSESVVLCDDSGSAYQIALHASGFYFRPSLTISEYLPDSMRVLHQLSFYTTVFTLHRDLDRSFDKIFAWISENKAQRLSEDEELKLIRSMISKTKEPNKALVPMPTSVTAPAVQEPRQP